jgi:hypothetical protein
VTDAYSSLDLQFTRILGLSKMRESYWHFTAVAVLGIAGRSIADTYGEQVPISTYTQFHTASNVAPQITIPLSPPAGYVLGGNTSTSTTPISSSVVAECTVTPLGWGQDDSGQIMVAAEKCGTDRIITLPAPYVYTVSQRLYMKLV